MSYFREIRESQVVEEAREARERMREDEAHARRLQRWCWCSRPILGSSYFSQRLCVRCRKLLSGEQR